MHRIVFTIIVGFIFGLNTFALAGIGKIALLKGQSEVERKGEKSALHQGDEIFELDIIHTMASSFIKIIMTDKTIIQLGPEASFQFTKNTNSGGLRQVVFELMKGKLRSAVRQKAQEGESIQFKSKTIALGVRGTEFLANAYMAEGKMTSDILLLKGKLAADVSPLEIPVKNFNVSEGQYFNTHQIAKDQGLQSIKTLSSDAVDKLLQAEDAFLPDLMDAKGVLQDLGQALSSTLGAGAGVLAGAATALLATAFSSSDEEKAIATQPAPQASTPQTTQVITKETVTVVYKDKEAPDPNDIREAKEQRKRMRKENHCYFWFYKILPGSFNPERFRRERDCNEYEFDL